MKPDDRDPIVERLMEGLEPPQPPPELRSKAIAAARRQIEAAEARDVWSRIWSSQGLRLAWAASVVVLLAGHILATYSPADSLRPVDPALMAESRVDEYMVGMLRPVRISENVQPLVGLFAGTEIPIELDLGGNPP
jgi:hypothetical protein